MSSESTPANHETESHTGWWFLPCVMTAGLIYAGVTLSPRLVQLDQLKRDYFNKQVSLLKLEADCLHQEKINRELRRNPEFAKWVRLRESTDVLVESQSNSIPLETELQFDGLHAANTDAEPVSGEYVSPNYIHVIQLAQLNPLINRSVLIIAGVLVVVGFLPRAGGNKTEGPNRQKGTANFLQRYHRSA